MDRTIIRVCRKLGLTPTKVLDVAVSSGISTCEWQESLNEAGFHPAMTATDLAMHAYLVQLYEWCHVLVDRDGYPLQFDVLGLALRPWSPRRYYLMGNGLWTACFRAFYWWVAKQSGLIERLKALGGASPLPGDPEVKARIQLVTRELRDRQGVTLLDDDIFGPTPLTLTRRFDVVRAANILNRDYFDPSTLRLGVDRLKERLVGPGALLAIVRTEHDGLNHGSIFQLRNDGTFVIVDKVGRGSEIEEIVVNLESPSKGEVVMREAQQVS